MSLDSNDDTLQEKLQPYEKWKNKFKDDWKYKQKLVVFEDADGNRVTPTTTTTTTTTPRPNITSPQQNVTKYTQPTKFSSVVVVTTEDPRSGKVTSADTTELIKIVGITCASLIGFLLITLIVIRCCRKSKAKRKERLTVRRPLHDAEREEHIYAEIEPLQAGRTPSPGGASGSSSDVRLPKKSKKRKGGVSSFRALSTRLYRFFSADTDDQSVFYNRNNQQASVRDLPPNPPERNAANGKKTKRINRFESTASRKPLLDGDSRTDVSPRDSTSSAADMRGNIYNPLLRENEGRAPSGPYDHLTLSKTQSGSIRDSSANPSSPHDYFTLEKTSKVENDEQADSGDLTVQQDSVSIENELHGGIDTIEEESEVTETPKHHDYFILEPHKRESTKKIDGNNSVESDKLAKRSKGSDKPGSPVKQGSPVKDSKSKPEITPRVTTASEGKSPTKSVPTSPANDLSSPYDVAVDIDANVNGKEGITKTKDVNRSESKEETYVLSKLGDAPKPPEVKNDNEYLSPADVERKPDYVDVYPNPPPRSSSLEPHELSEQKTSGQNSPSHSKIPKHGNTSPVHKTGNVSPSHKQNVSPKRSHKSPSHSQPVSPTRSKVETDI